ncbi:MAG: cation:proton antiporter [Halobacteria archaeon]|nr:cation:proton antiporter [Halobacteria archaeon]
MAPKDVEVVTLAESEILTALAVVFIGAGATLLVVSRLSVSSLPFYILVGMAVSPFVDYTTVLDLARWGIAFLVFVLATRIEFEAVSSVFRDIELATLAQITVVGPLGFGVGYLFGLDPLSSVYFAVAGTLSSTLVGSKYFETAGGYRLIHDRLSSSIHLFDDLVAVGVLLVLSAETYSTDAVAANIGYGAVILLAALFVYRYVFGLLVRLADGSDELVLMGALSVLFVFLTAAELAGVSAVVGAFAGGIAVRRDSTDAIEVFNGIQSIRDFFVTVFFVTLGALVEVPTLDVVLLAASLVVLVLFVNPAITVLSLVYEGYDTRTAHLVGTSTDQVSEMSLIIAIEGFLVGNLGTEIFDSIIVAAAATMALTTVVRSYGGLLYDGVLGSLISVRQTEKIDRRSHVEDVSNHVVVVGYGRQGRHITDVCERHDRDYVVIENDPLLWDDIRLTSGSYVFGDALTDYSWEKADVSDAELVVSTATTPRPPGRYSVSTPQPTWFSVRGRSRTRGDGSKRAQPTSQSPS